MGLERLNSFALFESGEFRLKPKYAMPHSIKKLTILTLFFYGAAFAAGATWVGNVSNNIWDPNNWSTTDLTGTLTIGAGGPYDPVQTTSFSGLGQGNRPSKLNTTTEANLTIAIKDLIPWSSDYINGNVKIMGGSLNIRSTTYVGKNGTATITIDGGHFAQKYTLYLGYGSGGNGAINILCGYLDLSSKPTIGASGGTGHIYIRPGGLGVINCPGNETTYFQGLVSSGIITTDPNSAILINYISSANKIEVTAREIVGASLPIPWDGVKEVNVTSLSFKPGTLAESSDVYLGTDEMAVTEANKTSEEYLDSTTENTISIPYALTNGTTYYWRVDTVMSGDVIKGQIWSFIPVSVIPPRKMEYLNRGLVAVKTGEAVYLSWRLLGDDTQDIAFNVYRGSTKLNSTPITDSTNFFDSRGGMFLSSYFVRPVTNGQEKMPSKTVSVWPNNYLDIPVRQVPGDTDWSYEINDGSAADLDGDGEYELIIKRYSGDYSEYPLIEAYKLDGTFLWRVNLGPNFIDMPEIHFIVYDFDSDGYAEVALRTAEGTTDFTGATIGDINGDGITDYRPYSSSQYILHGPEFISIFDGRTGQELARGDYIPRGVVTDWGDDYGHRASKFMMAAAYIDGHKPSLVICRGIYYGRDGYPDRTVIAAWNWRDGQLTNVWTFDTRFGPPENDAYRGQGNHNLSIGDVDGDLKDEIVYGSMTVDHDGTGLYSTGLGHGDAMHLSDFDPDRPGLEVWQCHETDASGATFRDAATGSIIFEYYHSGDVGRACAGDIDPRYRGCEVWASTGCPFYNCTGDTIGTKPSMINFMTWWDGDLCRELLDHAGSEGQWYGVIADWDYINQVQVNLLTATETRSNNWTKGNPVLSADILGDWREEAIWRTSDNRYIRLYTTTTQTEHRIYTLMHDPHYRISIAWQNDAYNQPPHTGFYLGDGMSPPPAPYIEVVNSTEWIYGDFTLNNIVDMNDMPYFIEVWLENDCNETAELDLNSDCIINSYEFSEMAKNWLEEPE